MTPPLFLKSRLSVAISTLALLRLGQRLQGAGGALQQRVDRFE